MKTKKIRRTTLALLPAALFTLTSCSSTSEPPPAVGSARITYTKGVPGGVIVQTFKTTATVTAIDQAKRKLTLLASDGKKFIVKAAPEVVNFDQIRVGDQITTTVTQKFVASLDKAGATSGGGTDAVVAETTQMTGRIIAIDSDKRTATLQFEDGNTETLQIRDDVDLSRRKVGEQVVFRVTEMMAIKVEKPQ